MNFPIYFHDFILKVQLPVDCLPVHPQGVASACPAWSLLSGDTPTTREYF